MDSFNFALLAFTSFFTLINPLGVIPIFVAMTSDLDDRNRAKTAWKASFVSLLTIVIFALTGQLLFKFFGISVNSFRIVIRKSFF